MVAWWRGENNTLDSFGTNNGSFLGTASYTNGEVGNAMLFNGVNNGVVVPASASLNVGTGNGLTIEAWVNPSEITPGGKANPVVEWNEGNGSSYGSAFWLTHPSVTIGNFFANLVDTSGGNHVIFSNSGLITTNVYQHVAVTYDKASGTAALYYNGVQVAVDTTFGQFTPQTTYPLYLGERPPGDINSWVFSGSMDEISIYNRALSSNEIAAIYLAGSGGKCFMPVPPFITSQPTNVTVNVGGSASFSVTAGGTAPLSYQWSFGTTNIAGATNTTLTLTNVQLTQAGSYSVLVTNIAGSTNSVAAVLTILAVPPTITAQPTNQTVQAGGTASFTVTAAGTPPLAYQWNFNGTNIAGATNATFTFTNVQFSQAGNYAVSVTNAYGSTNSSNATLSVVATLDHFAWSPISSPQGADVPFGVTITAENAFGVTVTNFTGSVSLQASSAVALTNSAAILNGGFETGTLTNWTLTNSAYGQFITNNGTFIPPGASGAIAPYAGSYCALGYDSGPGVFYMYQDISIPSGVSTATLSWAHRVRNYSTAFNSSQGFQVRICDTNNTVLATAFTTSPGDTLLGNWVQTNYDLTAFAGRAVRVMFWVDSASYYIDAYVDNVSLQLAANITIVPTNSGSFVNGAWSGNVTVQQTATNVVLAANDGSGHGGSSSPFDVVLAPPAITTQPTNETVFVGEPAGFSVTAGGTAPLSYQWQFAGTNIINATNVTLTLTNVQLAQEGFYSVLVTNIAGSTNSTSAVLTVLLPPAITTTMNGAEVQLAWPVSTGTFQLQSADSVLGPWNIVPPQTVATNGANVTVTVEATNQQQYFRLIEQ